ncbi:MAG TPA: Gfo/Idh/MocA family oxidoreductase [Rhizobiaceae bacterium]|nr:Gfo/Idh/MocA family oxidoreductase [Rhizobiaceae bacterium]
MSLRIAVLGAEHYHANFWIKAFLRSEGVAVAGVWDKDRAKAAALAGHHGVGVVENLDMLLGDSDAVAICSATSEHVGFVREASRRRLPILCEKPLGATVSDGLEIERIVKESGVPFMQSFPKRFDPINHEIRSLLADRALGTVTLCRIRHGHGHGFEKDFRRSWFADPALSGGGTLLDEGVHAADFLRWMFGEPGSVSAAISSAALGLPVEDTAVATFHFQSGMLAEVTTSWCFTAADASIEIYGTEGTLLLSGVDLASRATHESAFLRVYSRKAGRWSASSTVPHFKTGVFHEHVAWAFVRALKEGGPMPVTLEDGMRALAMVEAAYRSAASGRLEVVRPHSEPGAGS